MREVIYYIEVSDSFEFQKIWTRNMKVMAKYKKANIANKTSLPVHTTTSLTDRWIGQGILKGEVSLYH